MSPLIQYVKMMIIWCFHVRLHAIWCISMHVHLYIHDCSFGPSSYIRQFMLLTMGSYMNHQHHDMMWRSDGIHDYIMFNYVFDYDIAQLTKIITRSCRNRRPHLVNMVELWSSRYIVGCDLLTCSIRIPIIIYALWCQHSYILSLFRWLFAYIICICKF